MYQHPRRTGWNHATAISWLALLQRYAYVGFLLLASSLLVIGRLHPTFLETARSSVMDGLSPLLMAISRPITTIEQIANRAENMINLESENQKLRAENERLVAWRNAVQTLSNENREMRNLLHFKAEPGLSYISARVIADTGGPFVQSLVITAGQIDGVREGMAAMTGDGLIGRVVEVGSWSSRILLLTDLNSRLPVTIAGSGDHAILAGDNSPEPKLLHLPQDAALQSGARVLTSGHGGIFPPNLPVGVVSGSSQGIYRIQPLANMGRITYVQLVDFNLNGGAFNPFNTNSQPTAKRPDPHQAK